MRSSQPTQRLPGSATRLAAFGLGLSLCLAVRPAIAQPGEEAVFKGRQRVTAIDLVVEFEPRRGHEWLYERQIPKDLTAEDFEILYDDEPRPLVGLEEVTDFEVWVGEPWEIVLYFDQVLTSTRGLRRMASALGERLEALTAFGQVELVTASPLPRVRVTATRDVGELRRELSEMALVDEGRSELLTLRYQLLGELEALAAEDHPPMSPAELVYRVAAEEARIVRRQQDGLLTYLTARTEPAGEPGAAPTSRRAVFVVNDGYDLEPGTFYSQLLEKLGGAEPADAPFPGLLGATETLAHTLAAYGWVTFGLSLPPPPGPPPGVRVGKWLFTPAKPERMGPDPRYHIVDPMDRHTERRDLKNFWTFIGGIRGRYQERRDPDRARAYLELGRALAAQEKIADAEDAFRRAIYHFAEDKKFASLQAEAAVELGRLLDRQGKQEARHVLAAAYQLDAEVATEQLDPYAGFADATAPLALLARATAGWVVQDADELDQAIATLGHRVRLTYQVSGPPDGDLHPVTVEFERDGFDLHVPARARTATPEPVAAARARQLVRSPYAVAGDLRGNLYLDTRFEPDGALALRLAPPETWREDPDLPAWLRVTLGFGGPGTSEPTVEHRHFVRLPPPVPADPAPGGPLPWSERLEIVPPDDPGEPAFLSVLVEDLDSGSWGARVIDLGVE